MFDCWLVGQSNATKRVHSRFPRAMIHLYVSRFARIGERSDVGASDERRVAERRLPRSTRSIRKREDARYAPQARMGKRIGQSSRFATCFHGGCRAPSRLLPHERHRRNLRDPKSDVNDVVCRRSARFYYRYVLRRNVTLRFDGVEVSSSRLPLVSTKEMITVEQN